MTDTIAKTSLQPADILLYRGKGVLGRLIRFFDDSDVNHAGLYLGIDGGQPRVGEAVKEGVTKELLDVSVHDREYVWVRRLTNNAPLEPVLVVGQRYLSQGQRYAYEQLLLAAFLSMTRKLKITPLLSGLLRTILDGAASLIVQLTSGGREPMICSEFVYRCFDEADPAFHDAYAIFIDPFASPLPVELRVPVTGRGIHPDSLLARAYVARSRRVRHSFAPAAPAAMRASAAPSVAAIEEVAAAYLAEVASRPAASRGALTAPASLTEPDTLRALDNLANAWAGAVAAHPGGSPAAAASLDPLDLLKHAAANFVTPGDLIRTNSLHTLGKLEI